MPSRFPTRRIGTQSAFKLWQLPFQHSLTFLSGHSSYLWSSILFYHLPTQCMCMVGRSRAIYCSFLGLFLSCSSIRVARAWGSRVSKYLRVRRIASIALFRVTPGRIGYALSLESHWYRSLKTDNCTSSSPQQSIA